MYKKKLFLIKIIFAILLLVWFSCINFQYDNQNISDSDINGSDQTDLVKGSNYTWPAYNPTIYLMHKQESRNSQNLKIVFRM